MAALVDPYIAEKGALKGLMIRAVSFPGWDSFAGLLEHMKFVRDHHRHIERVAAVTDNAFLKIAPRIAQHFADPENRVFRSEESAGAMSWLETAVPGQPALPLLQEGLMPKTMKAAVVHELGRPLTIEEAPVPSRTWSDPRKIAAAGVCHTDLHAVEGDWPVKPSRPSSRAMKAWVTSSRRVPACIT